MGQKSLSYRFIFVHACCWAGYIFYEQLAVYVVSASYRFSAGTMLFYLINIGLFYSQSAILQRTVVKNKPDYLLAGCLTILGLCCFSGLKIIGEFFFNQDRSEYLSNAEAFRKTNVLDLVRSVFYVVGGTAYWAILHSMDLRKQAAAERIRQLTMAGINADLRGKLADTQNAYLRQQINPHLLFNTLNFVYSTVHKHAPAGGHAVYLLTEILDFSLRKNDESGRTDLAAEIGQIKNMITLNSYRFEFELPLKLVMEGDPSGHRIIPLVLLTLVENMFVHGEFRDKEARVAVTISPDGLLAFETRNAIIAGPGSRGRGTGLNNVRTRLEHAYPGRFRLSAGEAGQEFFIKLTIQL